ncbi:calcium-transporting ATPase 12 plasma membrane-type, partial [Phtheirospermum japonicum]
SASDQTVELQHIRQQRKSILEIVKNKNLRDLRSFGGVGGVAEALNTDLENGVSSPKQFFQYSQPTQLSYQILVILLHSFLSASNSYTIFLLSCAAILSLAFGVDQDGMHGLGWFNGAVLISIVCLIIIFTTIHKSWQEWSSKKLESSRHSKLGRAKRVLTVRDGNDELVGETDLVVGDIVVLRKGDQVPGDGLFIIRTGDQPLELNDGSVVDDNDPFLFYGSRVVNGSARMLVTSTGMDTVWGETMSQAILEEKRFKYFESYIHNLSTCIHISGLFISILIVVVLFLRYKFGKMDDERRYRPDIKGEPTRVITITDAIMGIITGTKGTARVLTTLLSVSLLGIVEGVPIVLSFAAIIWSRKALAEKATERDYLACLKMASVTTICTDKFGGLTELKKTIDKLYIGEELVSESSVVASEVLECLCDGIGAQLLIPPNDSEPAATVLLPEVISWAEANLGLKSESQCKMRSYRGRNPFQECCQVVMEKNGNDGLYLHFSGPPLDILSSCSHHYDTNGELKEIDGRKRSMLEGTIYGMLSEEAGVIAYACKQEPHDLILLGMISLKDVKVEDAKAAVSMLLEVGVGTILVSGVDVPVLEAIGQKGGLISPGSDDHLVLTGEEFRNLSEQERMDKLDKIRVIGNCLPPDKILLIKCLQEKGHAVAFLAQRTVDAPALKHADIGITFGTWSSEIAREYCDITIWDFNCFGFMVEVIKSGRCFQGNIRKFIQLHLIFTISSAMITLTAVVSSGDVPVSAVQLFWLNLVVTLFGGLALLAGPTMTIQSSTKLISKAMWRNIAIQASYQTTILVSLQHMGQAILGTSADRIKSVVYNGFFFCQLFNKFIAREPEKKNIFSGLFRNNSWFWVALVILLIFQGVFGVAERVLGSSPGLSFKLWGACLLIGLISLLLDWAGKTIASTFNSITSLFSAN